MASSIEKTFQKIKQNRPIQECLNTIPTGSSDDIADTIWFIYYMFFAIHNPKMEEYIQKKLATPATPAVAATQPSFTQAHRDIMKNMINRRNYTSSIVYQLYTYAYTNQGNPTHIYPNYKNDMSKQLIKSFQSNHLKTSAVLLRRMGGATAPLTALLEYIITTPTPPTPTAAPISVSLTTPETILNKINNQISYKRKDIIVIAMICYMKIDEHDINKKNVFITATEEDATTTATATAANEPELLLSPSVLSPISVYDDKYKYLYT